LRRRAGSKGHEGLFNITGDIVRELPAHWECGVEKEVWLSAPPPLLPTMEGMVENPLLCCDIGAAIAELLAVAKPTENVEGTRGFVEATAALLPSMGMLLMGVTGEPGTMPALLTMKFTWF